MIRFLKEYGFLYAMSVLVVISVLYALFYVDSAAPKVNITCYLPSGVAKHENVYYTTNLYGTYVLRNPTFYESNVIASYNNAIPCVISMPSD